MKELTKLVENTRRFNAMSMENFDTAYTLSKEELDPAIVHDPKANCWYFFGNHVYTRYSEDAIREWAERFGYTF